MIRWWPEPKAPYRHMRGFSMGIGQLCVRNCK